MTRLLAYPELQATARARRPGIAVVLGSGLSDLADRMTDVVELPFGLVPDLDAVGVPGHRGMLMLGSWADANVLVFAGRLHYYEGHPWRRVVQPIHLAHDLGTTVLLVTNAAGGIRADLAPGSVMAIRSHLDWTRGMTTSSSETSIAAEAAPYSGRLLDVWRAVDPALPTGVYAQLTGPCYETPAEIRALRACGADAVGMSTGREIQAGFELGMECAALSCITNKAAGLGTEPIHHQEVLDSGRMARDSLIGLIEAFIRGVSAANQK